MKKFTLIALVAVVLTAGSAEAVLETINGRDWEVNLDAAGGSSYSVGDNSLTLTGNWVLWDHAITAISVDVGHVIEFDFEQTNEGGAWIGDAGWLVMDNMTDWATAQRGIWTTDTNWYWNHSTNEWFEFSAGTDNIVHVVIEFPTATDYILTMDNGEQNLALERPIGGGLNPSGIGVFVISVWDTQQSTTVSDLYVGPPLWTSWLADPANGADTAPIDADPAWNAPAGFTPMGYELYLRACDPNFIDLARNIVNGESVDTTETDPVTYGLDTLDFNTTYYWRVDSIDPNNGVPITREGNVWSFTTVGASPLIAIFDNVLTALSLLDADLAAVVTDADNNMANVSWELLRDDITYPAGAAASVTDTTSDLYAPTATFSTDTVGTYFVKVTATDADGAPAKAIAEVRVLETACAAAQASGNWAGFDPLDSDTDCDIDMLDLAAFAAKWLSDIGLYGQEVWTGEVSYMPTPYGIPNGGFENGSLRGWKSETWASGEITDVPADVQEGTYACALLKSNDGVTTGVLDLPVGSHSITLWYKGDIPTFVCGFDDATTATYNITSHVFDGVDYVLVTGAVPAYTQFTVEFDVTVAGTGHFYAWGNGEGVGTAFVDDFQLNLNVN